MELSDPLTTHAASPITREALAELQIVTLEDLTRAKYSDLERYGIAAFTRVQLLRLLADNHLTIGGHAISQYALDDQLVPVPWVIETRHANTLLAFEYNGWLFDHDADDPITDATLSEMRPFVRRKGERAWPKLSPARHQEVQRLARTWISAREATLDNSELPTDTPHDGLEF